jgi:acetyl esterase/lipase
LDAELAGLPPLLVQWGSAEILRDQVRAFVERARAAGLDVTGREWPEMFHDFQLFAATVPEAAPAVEQIAAFLQDRVKG